MLNTCIPLLGDTSLFLKVIKPEMSRSLGLVVQCLVFTDQMIGQTLKSISNNADNRRVKKWSEQPHQSSMQKLKD